MVAIGDVAGAVCDPAGLDVPTLARVGARARVARGLRRATRLSHEQLLETTCDVLVLAAREDQVTAANAHALRCRLVVEGANGPTSVAADAILAERGIPVLPDVLTNAGGVTVSYFEWVQDLEPALLGPGRDPPPAGREARRRLRPRLERCPRADGVSLRERGARSPASARSPPRSRRGACTRERRPMHGDRAARPRRDGRRTRTRSTPPRPRRRRGRR